MTPTSPTVAAPNPGPRLLSLDFLRGFIMVALALGETGFFAKLSRAFDHPALNLLATEFSHPKWEGSHFWDFLQPAFMFVAGVALALSHDKQQRLLHYSWLQSLFKTLRRSALLCFWGVMIYAVRGDRLNLQFSNVLVMLSFSTLLSFLVIAWSPRAQFSVSALCLLVPELLFRLTHFPGFDQPFVQHHNFSDYVDLLVLHKPVGNYSPITNCVPNAVHTLWGLMAGQLLLRDGDAKFKLRWLTGTGFAALALGVGLHLAGITPVLKWISTSSYVLVTGGTVLLALAGAYFWIDVRGHRQHLGFFTVVGMNSVFIYLFYNFVGSHWLYGYVTTLCGGLLQLAGVPLAIGAAASCLVVFGLEWLLCWFLHRHKIFFRL